MKKTFKKLDSEIEVPELKEKKEYTLKVARCHLGKECVPGDVIMVDPEFVDRLKDAGVI